jgi:hypothetical protein
MAATVRGNAMFVQKITPARCHTALRQLAQGKTPRIPRESVALYLLDYNLPIEDRPSPKRQKRHDDSVQCLERQYSLNDPLS